MARRIPENIVEHLRNQADIVEIVGSSVSLKRQGQNFSGICPFHQEKTPSFVVSPAKQIYHCFGCGKGGNVFTFVMEHEGVGFQEAVEKLAARYGVSIPEEESSPAQRRQEARIKRFQQINQWAMEIFQEALGAGVGEPGRAYISGRGISDAIVQQFRLGYAPEQWDFLTKRLLAKQVEEQELLQLGLSSKTERGSLIDKFRGRLIFPILSERDQVVGFGGRVLAQGQPKYLNSQETPLFHKGQVLYGLSAAKNAIRQQDQVILMEGYMDVLTAFQYGLNYTVASLGTSLTADQARRLTMYTYRTLICYDSDAAGMAATLRGLDILDQQGCRTGVIRIPEGYDPDEYLKHYGKESFLQLAEKAPSQFEYHFLLNMEKFDRNENAGKVAIIQASLQELAKVKSPVARQGYIHMMADMLQFPETVIRDELKRYFGGYQSRYRTSPDKAPEIMTGGSEALAQSIVILNLLQDFGKQKDIEDAGGDSLFVHPSARSLYQTLDALIKAGYLDLSGEDLVTMIDREEERHWLTGILLEEPPPGDGDKVYQDSLLTLRRFRIERRIKQIMTELVAAERSGNASAAGEMMGALSELNMEKQRLR
ncbi:MAG: DNA primase [Clostridiales bacterium]|nr:DNA primase [Clostridiales bacterium]